MKRAEIEMIITEKYGQNAQYIIREIEDDLGFISRCDVKGDKELVDFCAKDALRKADRINECKLTPATAKVGDGATVKLFSDSHAGTIIKVTKKTITVQRDKATLDPNWKPEWVAGGFAGHCINQDEQSYTYERDTNGQTYTFRWSDKYNCYGQPNDLKAYKGRREFYDYNF